MDRRTVAKKSRKQRKKNVDNTPQQTDKEPTYFSNDSILEAAKFLNYEKWSQMRFLCRRVNQLIQSNQSKLQAFEVNRLSVEKILRSSNSIVSFDQGIQPADAVRKWFQDRGYSCDETTDIPLDKVFVGLGSWFGKSASNGLYFTVRAFFEAPSEKNMQLTRSQAKQMRKKRTGKGRRHFSSGVILRYGMPNLFSAECNAKYEFYGPILLHIFRLLHHPVAYFREVSMFPPMTDKFCDEATKNFIHCEQFTLQYLDSSLEYPLNWLKDNVRAQNITISFKYYHATPCSYLHSLVSEFILQNAPICAQDRIKLDSIPEPGEFVSELIKNYEFLEVTKAIPSIVLEFKLGFSKIMQESFELNLDATDDPPLYDKRCDRCDIKTYERLIQLDKSRKLIAQVRRCFERECLCGSSMAYMRFE